jgi:hypothetical protein
MDKYRLLSVELVSSVGTDSHKVACEKYRTLLKECGANEVAQKWTDEEMVEAAKFFLQSMPPFFRTI